MVMLIDYPIRLSKKVVTKKRKCTRLDSGYLIDELLLYTVTSDHFIDNNKHDDC